jgi:hypothetical protein
VQDHEHLKLKVSYPFRTSKPNLQPTKPLTGMTATSGDRHLRTCIYTQLNPEQCRDSKVPVVDLHICD